MNEQLKQKLDSINWDFSDYNSSKYPLDLNSIHWYLATFPPLIPMYLISLLSKEGEVVLDPFGGAGTTAIKSIELNRRFVYNDLNPFAVEIAKAKVALINLAIKQPDFLSNEEERIEQFRLHENNIEQFIVSQGIDEKTKKWYEPQTLLELCSILNLIVNDVLANEQEVIIRHCAFSAILKASCSQTDHITYITDNCCPKSLIYINAIKLYLDQISTTRMAAREFKKRYTAIFANHDNIIENLTNSIIHSGDSRKMDWIKDNSIDLVVTSPPYLCAQDYIKTMRLTNMFFHNEAAKEKMQMEIGSRRKRSSNSAKTVAEYYNDMDQIFAEISRVLKNGKYFCLIIGQGSGKITKEYDTVNDLKALLQEKHGFSLEYSAKRHIWSRRIHVGGVSEESILVFKKAKVEL